MDAAAANQNAAWLHSKVEFSFQSAAGCLQHRPDPTGHNKDAHSLPDDKVRQDRHARKNKSDFTDHVSEERMFSYPGPSQSRAGTEGQPSLSSSPHTLSHGPLSGSP